VYYNKGEYDKAEPLLQRALAIREKALGPENTNVATSLSNLALLSDSRGDHDKAEPLYRRALAIREKAYGTEHPRVALTLNNLAMLNYNKGDYASAERFTSALSQSGRKRSGQRIRMSLLRSATLGRFIWSGMRRRRPSKLVAEPLKSARSILTVISPSAPNARNSATLPLFQDSRMRSFHCTFVPPLMTPRLVTWPSPPFCAARGARWMR